MSKNRTVWIRHAEKMYNNGFPVNGGKKHDPGIIVDKDVFLHVGMLVDELVITWGKPDRIIVSPFLRTRQTCSLICNSLAEKYKVSPKIEYDTDIGEYLGFCKSNQLNEIADVENETRSLYSFPIKLRESLQDLNKRVYQHIKRIFTLEENIWVVTHGIVISRVYSNLYNAKLERPKPLEYIVY
jgi:broad specificity phosphatase PhoE